MEGSTDIDYLKTYVSKHPDNRMAWYLLGKAYEERGKEAKANYCFLQSGDVFEAFERKRHPLADEPEVLIGEWNRRRKRRTALRRAMLVAALLLLGLTGSPAAPEDRIGPAELRPGETVEEGQGKQRLTEGEEAWSMGTAAGLAVAFAPRGSEPALTALLSARDADYGIAAKMEEAGVWRRWDGDTRILLTVRRENGDGRWLVRTHDAAWCRCMPAETGDAPRLLREWSGLQEQRWTLVSAIAHYERLHGRLPRGLSELVRPYPDNMLSGDTPEMRAMLPELLRSFAKADNGTADSNPAENGGGDSSLGLPDGTASAASGLPDEPLRILVDTSRHRLAVVTGDVIVRVYPVGLGGERTPEGTFAITEKVKNPNGRDDGPFGSRGMTLSDTPYAIHGTDEPETVGGDNSLGCVRMLREDLEELYDLVPIGTEVVIKKGIVPAAPAVPRERFALEPQEDETNPGKVYDWL
ncbi:ErfK/YbiS/YcfS/YnhG family protein [Paenibacillus sp. 32O-W]|uniref:L,D-transpeptidase n=1 Tax=Paenibacillus sp. 32O-W TaxID=1695218 RepID=UPI00071EAB95|nr:L,D-transpeptidase [Paenibacillus sp. 32O-W]ALS28954.1 ErfK/YbiS/YcfS/YnhG family protein [Paenibacillus sp. 32O-W]